MGDVDLDTWEREFEPRPTGRGGRNARFGLLIQRCAPPSERGGYYYGWPTPPHHTVPDSSAR